MSRPLDLFVVGAGPTGIAIGAEARRAGLEVLLVDRGPLVASLVDYPAEMTFFTTRERLEIADIPFAIPEDKPNRRQAISYYQAVAAHYRIPLATGEEVLSVARRAGGPAGDGGFAVRSRARHGEVERHALAVAVATGYFTCPRRLGVPGEDLPWVHARYHEPYAHFGERVVIVGGGNSGAEAALDLFRHGARVTLVHRDVALKATVKYWIKPDLENRIEEGGIEALFSAEVAAFDPGGAVVVRTAAGGRSIPCDACYVQIGYEPDPRLLRAAGVEVDPETLTPRFDESSCESDVPGLYVAGTVQAGRATSLIFIENSRDHGPRIVRHLLASGRLPGRTAPSVD
jgi:thioredoxin reductase (NADPH)